MSVRNEKLEIVPWIPLIKKGNVYGHVDPQADAYLLGFEEMHPIHVASIDDPFSIDLEYHSKRQLIKVRKTYSKFDRERITKPNEDITKVTEKEDNEIYSLEHFRSGIPQEIGKNTKSAEDALETIDLTHASDRTTFSSQVTLSNVKELRTYASKKNKINDGLSKKTSQPQSLNILPVLYPIPNDLMNKLKGQKNIKVLPALKINRDRVELLPHNVNVLESILQPGEKMDANALSKENEEIHKFVTINSSNLDVRSGLKVANFASINNSSFVSPNLNELSTRSDSEKNDANGDFTSATTHPKQQSILLNTFINDSLVLANESLRRVKESAARLEDKKNENSVGVTSSLRNALLNAMLVPKKPTDTKQNVLTKLTDNTSFSNASQNSNSLQGKKIILVKKNENIELKPLNSQKVPEIVPKTFHKPLILRSKIKKIISVSGGVTYENKNRNDTLKLPVTQQPVNVKIISNNLENKQPTKTSNDNQEKEIKGDNELITKENTINHISVDKQMKDKLEITVDNIGDHPEKNTTQEITQVMQTNLKDDESLSDKDEYLQCDLSTDAINEIILGTNPSSTNGITHNLLDRAGKSPYSSEVINAQSSSLETNKTFQFQSSSEHSAVCDYLTENGEKLENEKLDQPLSEDKTKNSIPVLQQTVQQKNSDLNKEEMVKTKSTAVQVDETSSVLRSEATTSTTKSVEDRGINTDILDLGGDIDSLGGFSQFPSPSYSLPLDLNDIDDIFRIGTSFGSPSDLSASPRPEPLLNRSRSATPQNANEKLKLCFFRDMKMCLEQDLSGNMPIHVAVLKEDLKQVKRQCIVLFARLRSVDVRNSEGFTPLQLAIINQVNADIVNILLKYHARLTEPDFEGNNPFHLAVYNSNIGILKKLIFYGKNVISEVDTHNFEGLTPLMISVLNDQFSVAEELLIAGFSPNIKDKKSGRTALFHAVEENNARMVKLLLHFKADTRLENFFGTSPHDAVFELSNIQDNVKTLILDRKLIQRYRQNREKQKRKASQSPDCSLHYKRTYGGKRSNSEEDLKEKYRKDE